MTLMMIVGPTSVDDRAVTATSSTDGLQRTFFGNGVARAGLGQCGAGEAGL